MTNLSGNELFTIQDQNGNYASQLSFQVDLILNVAKYISCTGRCNGMRYYTKKSEAIKVLNYLKKINKKLKTSYKFTLAEIDMYTLPRGKLIIKIVIPFAA